VWDALAQMQVIARCEMMDLVSSLLPQTSIHKVEYETIDWVFDPFGHFPFGITNAAGLRNSIVLAT